MGESAIGLLPCKCGANSQIITEHSPGTWTVYCNSCGLNENEVYGGTKQDAMQAWQDSRMLNKICDSSKENKMGEEKKKDKKEMHIKSIITKENVCYMVGQKFNQMRLPDLGQPLIVGIRIAGIIKEECVEPPWHEVVLEDGKIVRVYGVVEAVYE